MKDASELLKMAKVLMGASTAPMTDEEKDWYDVLERYLERLVIDGEKMRNIDVQKWDTGILLEASYGYVDEAWIVIETDDKRMMVDFTPSGERNPTKKARFRGDYFDKPKIAISMIEKVTKGHK